MRLTFDALPTPCPDAKPTQAPALFLDAGGALHWNDGTRALILFPWGNHGQIDAAAHARAWKPATCVDLSSGVTIRADLSVGAGEDAGDDTTIARAMTARAMTVGALDVADPSEWPDIVARGVLEWGGTYPLRALSVDGAVTHIIFLHGVQGTGRTESEAIDNWIAAARVGIRPRRLDSAYCGKPRNHAEEIDQLRRSEGAI